MSTFVGEAIGMGLIVFGLMIYGAYKYGRNN